MSVADGVHVDAGVEVTVGVDVAGDVEVGVEDGVCVGVDVADAVNVFAGVGKAQFPGAPTQTQPTSASWPAPQGGVAPGTPPAHMLKPWQQTGIGVGVGVCEEVAEAVADGVCVGVAVKLRGGGGVVGDADGVSVGNGVAGAQPPAHTSLALNIDAGQPEARQRSMQSVAMMPSEQNAAQLPP